MEFDDWGSPRDAAPSQCPCDTSHIEPDCFCDAPGGVAAGPWKRPPPPPAAAAGGGPASKAPCPCDESHVDPDCFCAPGAAAAAAQPQFFEAAAPGAPEPMDVAEARVHEMATAMDEEPRVCDACPFCFDVCADPKCPGCAEKRRQPRPRLRTSDVYTACEVRRHCTAESCWLVAGRDVIDATKFLSRHPAGTKSIVRNSGGRDCTEDLGFHSAKAQKLWYQHKIGRLVPCPSEKSREDPRACAIS